MRILLIFTLCLASAGCFSSERVSTTPNARSDLNREHWTVEQLSTLIGSVTPWSKQSAYTTNDWSKIVAVAKIFQSVGTNTAAEAFNRFSFQDTNDDHDDYLEISKPFLLLCVMFDLPEHVRSAAHGSPGFEAFGTNVNPDGTVNYDWPLKWENGKPSLCADYFGYNGPIYHPADNYQYLYQHYKFRDLSHFK